MQRSVSLSFYAFLSARDSYFFRSQSMMFEFEFLNIVILTRMSLRSICFNRSIAMITKELSLSSSVCPFFRYIFVRSDCTTEERARSQQLDCRYLDFGENFVSIKITVIRKRVSQNRFCCVLPMHALLQRFLRQSILTQHQQQQCQKALY